MADIFKDVDFIYPVHLNPNVRRLAFKLLSGINNVHLLPPAGYIPFIWLMRVSHLVLTDSGGIQEEAPSLGKPVLVMRDKTERPEAVDAGTSLLVGTDKGRIIRETSRLITNRAAWEAMSKKKNPYGDGNAAPRIVDFLAGLK